METVKQIFRLITSYKAISLELGIIIVKPKQFNKDPADFNECLKSINMLWNLQWLIAFLMSHIKVIKLFKDPCYQAIESYISSPTPEQKGRKSKDIRYIYIAYWCIISLPFTWVKQDFFSLFLAEKPARVSSKYCLYWW